MLLALLFPAAAEVSSATLTGPGYAYAGELVTITFRLRGTNVGALSGMLDYNSDQLELKETKQLLASPWRMNFSGPSFSASAGGETVSFLSDTAAFSASFQLKPAAAGKQVTVTVKDLKATADGSEKSLAAVKYSVSALAAASSNNYLASLTVSNAKISLEFDRDITNYTTTADYNVAYLLIKATPEDSRARTIIDNPLLSSDKLANVTVRVIAENGAERVYTIQAIKAKPPPPSAGNNNPKPTNPTASAKPTATAPTTTATSNVKSKNNNLGSLELSNAELAPKFDKSVTEYSTSVPFDVLKLDIHAQAEDEKAEVILENPELTEGGVTAVFVHVKAEDGRLNTYTIAVSRGANPISMNETTTTRPTMAFTTAPPTTIAPPANKGEDSPGSGVDAKTFIFVVLALWIGFFGGYILLPNEKLPASLRKLFKKKGQSG